LPEQPGDVRHTFADIGRAREALGYAPRVPIGDGIPMFVDWFRREGAGASAVR
jgi:UDP-glucuronate 4-epimerase